MDERHAAITAAVRGRSVPVLCLGQGGRVAPGDDADLLGQAARETEETITRHVVITIQQMLLHINYVIKLMLLRSFERRVDAY